MQTSLALCLAGGVSPEQDLWFPCAAHSIKKDGGISKYTSLLALGFRYAPYKKTTSHKNFRTWGEKSDGGVYVFEPNSIWTCVSVSMPTLEGEHASIPFSPCSSNTLSSHSSPIAPYPHSPHVALSPSLTDLTSPLTPASLLKLGAPVITTLSPLTHLTHSHAAPLIPLSLCPRFSSQSSTSGMNIAEVVWCRRALWFYSIPTCEWRRGRLMTHGVCWDWWRSEVDAGMDWYHNLIPSNTLLLLIIYWKCTFKNAHLKVWEWDVTKWSYILIVSVFMWRQWSDSVCQIISSWKICIALKTMCQKNKIKVWHFGK